MALVALLVPTEDENISRSKSECKQENISTQNLL
jgi:hypothetical protein